MNEQITKFKQLIDASSKVIITSHISPDPDALASVLLLGTTLKLNFADKQIQMVLEEKPASDLSFLEGYDQVQFKQLLQSVDNFKPNLLIMVDAMNLERCCRNDGQAVREALKTMGTKTAIIDHHEKVDADQADFYYNQDSPACAEDIYDLAFKQLGFNKPHGYAQTTLLGIITDTARFKYNNPQYKATFGIVSELLDSGASIEELENRIQRYNHQQMTVFANLAKNITDSGKGYTYTFIDDDFDLPGQTQEMKISSFKAACEIFTSQFLRNFENNNWGFVVYPDLMAGPGMYAVSLRAVSGGKDVAAIARQLGGGGHKQAAGAKNIQADSVTEAIQKVKQVI